MKQNGIEFIEALVSLKSAEISALEGISQEDASIIMKIIAENVQIVEEETAEISVQEPVTVSPVPEEELIEEESYECPECGATINPEMTSCPNCGVGLSFEEEKE